MSAAYAGYVREHRRLRRLIESLDCLPEKLRPLALRGATVLVVAEVEAFVRGLLQERIDQISQAWPEMLPAERRVVAARVLGEFTNILEGPHQSVRNQSDAEHIADTARRVMSWIDEPGRFARDVPAAELRDFYDPSNVARVLNRALVELRDDGIAFFDWFGSHGADMASYQLSVQALVAARVDAAHQLHHGVALTPYELREHQRRIAAIVRAARSYAEGAPLGNRPGASRDREAGGR